MTFAALALDYDGTIATDGILNSAVREAIGCVRRRGVAVALVTGRRLADLRQVAGGVVAGECVIEPDASPAGAIPEVIRAQPAAGATRLPYKRILCPSISRRHRWPRCPSPSQSRRNQTRSSRSPRRLADRKRSVRHPLRHAGVSL